MQDQAITSQSDLIVQLRTAPCEEIPEWARVLKVKENEVVVFAKTQEEMTHQLKEAVFNVTKTNMKAMYEASSWGWSDHNKWLSINNTALRFILCFREPSEGRPQQHPDDLVGFLTYKYELYYSDAGDGPLEASAFVYEAQVVESVQGLGIGRQIMAVLDDVAAKAGVFRLGLCVFRFNGPALAFYEGPAGYSINWDVAYNWKPAEDVFFLAKLLGQARSPNERGGGRGVGLGVTDAMVDRSAGGGGRAPGGDEEVTCLLLCKGATRTADPWRGRRRSLPGSTLLGAGKLSGGQGAPGGSMLRRRAMEDGAADAGSADEDATKGRGEVTEGSVFGAALLFAGTAIGAGMLALPAETASAGFAPSEAALLFCWMFTLVSSLFTLEAVWFISADDKEGEAASADGSFLTMSQASLGPVGEACTATIFWFLLTAICVAYIAEGGHLLAAGARAAGLASCPDQAGSVAFVSVFAAFAVAGTKYVDDANRVFMAGLVASFAGLVAAAAAKVDVSLLARADWTEVWPKGISIGVLSFGAQNIVPTLFSYLGRDPLRTREAVLLGTCFPLAIYSIWELVTLGSVSLESLGANPNQDAFLEKLAGGVGQLGGVVSAFSVFAIASSMAGASVSFVDFWQDGLTSLGLFKDAASTEAGEDTSADAIAPGLIAERGAADALAGGGVGVEGGRVVAAAAALVPALLFATASEDAFLSALETAGVLFGVSLYGVLPSLMVWRLRAASASEAADGRATLREMPGRVPGGDAAVVATGVGSALLVLPELAHVLGLHL